MTMLFDCETIRPLPLQQSLQNLGCNQQDQPMIRSLLLVAATGTGKTVMMGGLAKHWPVGRVMMLSHRFELNQQAMKAFSNICGEDVDLEQASYHADSFGQEHRIVVASVQTLNSKRKGKYRMEKFRPEDFGLIMVDEAHRAAAESYRKVFEYFGQNPHCRFVGVTATPDRLDKVGLGCVFDDVACNYDIGWSIRNGWLVEPKQKFVQIDGLDLRNVKTIGGDLDAKQLSRIVELEENLHAMAKPIVDVAGIKQQTIVFTASVPQAHRLAELIRDYWQRQFGNCAPLKAVSLDGSLNPQDPRRRQIVRDFKEGSIQFLVNCGVATEGFDAPSVSLIAVGRPTKSRALYTQMVGRGTRPLTGIVDPFESAGDRIAAIAGSAKPNCTVLDFLGQSGRHSLVCTTDILGGDEPEEIQERAKRIASQKDFDGTTLDAIRKAREEAEAAHEARRAHITVGVNYQLRDAKTVYDLASIPKRAGNNYLISKPVSEKQTKFMLKLGFTSAQIGSMNQKTARESIDFALANPRTNFAKWIVSQKAKEPDNG